MENKTQTEFHVVLNGIKFSEETEKKIEKDIQKIVMAELVNYTPPAVPDAGEQPIVLCVCGIPHPWLGIPAWLVNPKVVEEVLKTSGLGGIDAGFGGYTAGSNQ